jgi:type VII secretion-associated serine protease mycosin
VTGLTRLRRRAVRRTAGAALLTTASLVATVTGPTAAPASAAPVVTVLTRPVQADAVRDEQWQIKELDAGSAWKLSTGKGVTVAVIDSGVDGSHPDLAGQVLHGTDLVREAGDGQFDPVGHGTTVAGLIAGRNDDSRGVIGLAPDAKILPVRVLDEENRYDDALIVARGVRWAVDNGAQVINMSLGGTGDSPALAAALDYAFARNVVVVACTGNLTSSTPVNKVWYPARERGVVAVAGLDHDTDGLWTGSITGPETVLTAPATGLTGARPGGFWEVQGTSFAAPLVAASAALVRARWPQMSAGDVINRLVETARDLGSPGRDAQFGFGLVNPVAALTGTVPEVVRNPLDDDVSPGIAGFGPAPGLARASPLVTRQPSQLGGGFAPSNRPRWEARTAGQTTDLNRDGVWGWGVMGGLLLLGCTLFARRRFGRTRRYL